MDIEETSIDDIKYLNVFTVKRMSMTHIDTLKKWLMTTPLIFTMADVAQIYLLQKWFTS